MSQNDFTIANQGFPAFRADLNSALQALASNSSGATAPSTTFANMWWYDSANNIMYIRNEDNDAWIKFAELDQTNDKFVLSGTLQLDDGTVSSPALTFNSDTNMGIYRGGTDILKFVTAGTDAITINASQDVSLAGSLNFADNEKAIFGAGSDLQIYHDGAGNSFINESGSGSLFMQGDNIRFRTTDGTGTYALFTTAGAVDLYHNNSPKLATTSTGIDVTGTVTADGLTVEGSATIQDATEPSLRIVDTNNVNSDFTIFSPAASNVLQIKDVSNKTLIEFQPDGDISFYEDTGTTPKFFWDSSAEFLGIGTIIPDAPITIQPTAQGLGTNVVQNWMYSLTSGSEFDLKLNHIVAAGLVKYSFNLRNNGTSYNNNLVLDRGNVGIGTSSPSSYSSTTLEVKGSSTSSAIKMTNSTTGVGNALGFDFELNGNDINYVNRTASGKQKFWVNSTQAMTLTQNKNLAIGTTAPEYAKLHVTSQGNITTPGLFEDTTTGTSSVTAVVFKRNGSNVGAINTTNTSTAYVTSSDHRLKENVVEMTDATTRLKQLQPKRFNFIADADTTLDGFLAHEVQSVVPEAITGTHNEVDDDGNPVYQGIDHSRLVPLLVKTIQELEARIVALETA